MKALKLALAISLALNLVLCWKVWQSPPKTHDAGASSVSMLIEPPLPEPLQLPEGEDLLLQPPNPLLVPSLRQTVQPASEASPLRRVNLLEDPSSGRPLYANPLPSNPHAVPLWEKRVPYRETQLDKGLYPKMKVEPVPERD